MYGMPIATSFLGIDRGDDTISDLGQATVLGVGDGRVVRTTSFRARGETLANDESRVAFVFVDFGEHAGIVFDQLLGHRSSRLFGVQHGFFRLVVVFNVTRRIFKPLVPIQLQLVVGVGGRIEETSGDIENSVHRF